MMKPNRLTTACSAALLALGLAACGSGSNTTVPVDPEPVPPVAVDLTGLTTGYMAEAGMIEIAAGKSMDHGDIAFSCAADGEACMVEVMVADDGMVTAMSTGGTVTAMDTALRTAVLALDDETRRADALQGEVDALQGRADALQGEVDGLQGEKDAAAREERRADASAMAKAIGPGAESPKPRPYTPNGGIMAKDNKGEFVLSSRPIIPIGNATGMRYWRGPNDQDPAGHAVVNYTTKEADMDAAFSEYYAPGNKTPAATMSGYNHVMWPNAVMSVHSTGAVVFKQDVKMDSGKFSSAMFPDTPTTTRVYEGDDRTFDGMFHGVEGTYICASDSPKCSATTDGMRKLSMLEGNWRFRADAVAEGDDPHMVAGVLTATDYVDFGYWVKITAELASDGSGGRAFQFRPHVRVSKKYIPPTMMDDAMTYVMPSGKATYDGVATGAYVKKADVNGMMVPDMAGQFVAEAMLEADFDNSNITGEVSMFMDAYGNMIDEGWSLELMPATFASNIEGTGTGGSDAMTMPMMGDDGGMGTSGKWYARFHGDAGTDPMMVMQPSAVVGTFDGHFVNGHVGGVFAAEMMEGNGDG